MNTPKILIFILAVTVSLLCFAGCSEQKTNGILVFQSDFGLKDGAVSEMKGVALSVDQNLQLYDITHEIPSFSIWDASYRLYQAFAYWPENTVFVSVVDPGVGSERKSLVAKMRNGSYIVTPDNGTLTLLKGEIEEIRVIDETENRLPGSENSATFHGRDVYAYTGARLACGKIQFEDVGELLVGEPVMLEYTEACITENGLTGMIEMLDSQYGNVWTNISEDMAEIYPLENGREYNVVITNGGERVFTSKIKYVSTFSDVKAGDPLIYENSLGKIALAVNSGSFADTYGISYGDSWCILIQSDSKL